ncbi:50S ribosomal protein L11 methyltransferase [Nisaea acidiphila]|uniref:50S ribosomal protein L11 methyltransferase n=1 Tax=Nisaea acidiphila TaxID=1862145 RepID=A0A9J7AW03_9PROT|nr:50S ribosomal protein L11 methyltransferase [Nisaea acidiphila]UUX51971.1 50S ribosomal protein L11 methyltransferase [Nisaea acidiphila]
MTPGGGLSIPAEFVLRNTELVTAPLVPEIRLHLATDISPLWEATEEELQRHGLPPPYWAFAWAGGQALARYVIDHPATVAGRRVLDVGAGSGIVSLASLWVSAATVVANDIDPVSALAVRLNAEENGLSAGLDIACRDMLDEPALADDGGPLFDTVLAGDVFYERGMAERALAWLRRHAAAGALVLVGDPGRAYLPKGGMVHCGRYQVPVPAELEDREVKETSIWQLAEDAGLIPKRS